MAFTNSYNAKSRGSRRGKYFTPLVVEYDCEAWGSYHLAPQPNQAHLLPDRGGMGLLLTSGLNVRLCSETSGDVGSDQKVVVLGGFARVAGPFV